LRPCGVDRWRVFDIDHGENATDRSCVLDKTLIRKLGRRLKTGTLSFSGDVAETTFKSIYAADSLTLCLAERAAE